MGFLIRCAFWLSLALLFIPLDTGDEPPDVEPVGPLQTLAAAGEAVRDFAGLCERQPEACAVVGTALQTIAMRASEGLRLAEMLTGDEPSPQAAPKEASGPNEPVPADPSAPQE